MSDADQLAHDIRDYNRITAKAVCALEATSRWAVTGTPIQNKLLDFASLYKFLRISPYENIRTFQDHVNHLRANLCEEAALDRLRCLVQCIMLRRSIGTVELPARHDTMHLLEFSVAEADLYETARRSTVRNIGRAVQDEGSAGGFNVLPWINCLRMICNLGTRAKLPAEASLDSAWDAKAAQELFNSLIATGVAICRICSADLALAASEVADQPEDGADTGLTECSYLMCGSCRGKTQDVKEACGHQPTHPLTTVSALCSNLPLGKSDSVLRQDPPTKVVALMRDLRHNIEHEKW